MFGGFFPAACLVVVVVVVVVGVVKRHECSSRRECFLAAMTTVLTPLVHLRIRARELLIDQLAYEGVSEIGRTQADAIAVQLWDATTVDELLREVQESLPSDAFGILLQFCRREYPLLFASLPSNITGESLQLFRSQYRTVFKLGQEQRMAVERLSKYAARNTATAFDPVPSPGPTEGGSAEAGPPSWGKQ